LCGNFRWRLKDELEHRANTIRELQGQGYNIPQIAQELQLSVSTIKKISARLHRESRENYQKLILERIPYDVDVTLELYKSIKRQCKELAETTDKDVVRVKALDLLQRAGKEYIDLEMRGNYVKRSLDVAGHIQKKLNEVPPPPPDTAGSSSQSEEEEREEEGDEELEEEMEEEVEKEAQYGSSSQRKF